MGTSLCKNRSRVSPSTEKTGEGENQSTSDECRASQGSGLEITDELTTGLVSEHHDTTIAAMEKKHSGSTILLESVKSEQLVTRDPEQSVQVDEAVDLQPSEEVTTVLKTNSTTGKAVDESVMPHTEIKPAGTSRNNKEVTISVDIAELPEATESDIVTFTSTSPGEESKSQKDVIDNTSNKQMEDSKSISGSPKHSVITVKPLHSGSDDNDRGSTHSEKLEGQESALQDAITPLTESISEHLEGSDQESTTSESETVQKFQTVSSDDDVSHHSIRNNQSLVPESDANKENDYCKSVYARLIAKKSEKPIRDKVTAVLKAWETSGKLEELEKSVRNIKASSTGTIADLAQALKRGYNTDSTVRQIALAYKVYCWVTTNIRYSKHALGVSDPKSVLRTRLAVCHGYSTLFQAICREVGLEVNRVDGNTRSLQDCKWTLDDSDSHTWNMVGIHNYYHMQYMYYIRLP